MPKNEELKAVQVSKSLTEKIDQRKSETTLGDLLYAEASQVTVSEKDWVRLLRWIAAGDPLALHALFEKTHRIVFTFIFRATNSNETAEELTLDVFYDVWQKASDYDPAQGSVVSWIMHFARSRVLGRLTFDQQPLLNTVRTDESEHRSLASEERERLETALGVLTLEERRVIEALFFTELTCPEAAAISDETERNLKAQAHAGLGKLQKAFGSTSRES
jgi:RNA polymerase sigma-70 factor (ECF subfamily)